MAAQEGAMEAYLYLIVLSGWLASSITWYVMSRYYRLQVRLAHRQAPNECRRVAARRADTLG